MTVLYIHYKDANGDMRSRPAKKKEILGHPVNDKLREAVHAALVYCQANVSCTSYGGFYGGDPRDFIPDSDNTEAEIKAWEDACAAYEKPLDNPHVSQHDENGNLILHISVNPFGYGITTYKDEDLAKLAKILEEAL